MTSGKKKKVKSPIRNQRAVIPEDRVVRTRRDDGLLGHLKLAENKYYGVIIVDAETLLVRFANRRIRQALSYTKSEIQKVNMLSLIAPEDHARILKTARARLSGRSVKTSNRYTAIGKNGKRLIFEAYTVIISYSGRKYIQSVINNVTDRVRLEKEVGESEARFKGIFELSPAGIFTVDQDGRITSLNKAFENLTGYQRAHLKGRFCQKLNIWKIGCQDLMQKGMRRPLETELVRKDGQIRLVRIISKKMPLTAGRYETMSMITDITAEKMALEKLEENEERFRGLVENLHYGFYIINLGTNQLLYLNKYARNLLRKLRDIADIYTLLKHIGGTKYKELTALYGKFKAEKLKSASGMHKFQLPDDRILWVEFEGALTRFGGQPCIQGIFRDVTELMEADRKLHDSEERFRQMAENIREVFWVLEKEPRRFSYISPLYEEIFGLTCKELYRDHNAYQKAIHPEDRKLVAGLMNDFEKPTDQEYRIIRADGEIRWVRALTFPILDENRKVYRSAGIVRDTTEEKRAANALRESELKFRAIFENTTDGIAIYERHYKGRRLRMIDCNDSCARQAGRSRAELLAAADIERLRKAQLSEDELAEINRRLENGRAFQGTFSWLRPDGQENYIEYEAAPVILGERILIYTIERDIFSRREAEEALKESEERYRSVVNNIGIGISLISPRMEILSLNNQMKKWFPLIKVQDKPICYKAFNYPARKNICAYCPTAKTLRDGQVHTDVSETPTPQGLRNYRIISSPIRDSEGKVVAAIEMVDDITESRRAEEEIRKFKTISDKAAYGNIILDKNFRVVYCNESFAQMHGMTIAEVLGNDLLANHTREQIKRILKPEDLGGKIEGTQALEIMHMKKDGTMFPILMNGQVITGADGKPIYISVSCIDISARKKAEEALRESEEKFRLISEQTMLGLCIIQDDEVKFVNSAAANMFGFSVEEVHNVGTKGGIDLIHPLDKEKMIEAGKAANANRIGRDQRFTLRIYSKSGEMKWIDLFARAIRLDGKTASLLALVDITERMRAEAALIEERDRLSLIFEHIPVMVAAFDEDLRIIAWNQTSVKISGYEKAEMTNNPRALEEISINQKHFQEISKRLRADRQESGNWEWQIRTKGGEIRMIAWSSVSGRIPVPGFTYWGIGLDITEKKKAEVALKNQRDMLRDVTGHVISVQEDERRRISMELHDSIGQSLSVTKLQIQNLQRRIRNGQYDVQEGLEAISRVVTDTITDLRQISANLRPVILDNLGLWPTIDWYLKDFAKTADLEVSVEIGANMPSLPPQTEVHIFRVIQEIMINIQKHSKAHRVAFAGRSEDSRVVLEIHEDGLGFNQEGIFDPAARKRGMGLINIMERVKIVNGKIDFRSETDKGCHYVVEIPLTNPPAPNNIPI